MLCVSMWPLEKAVLLKMYFLVSEEENYRLHVFTLAIWSKVDKRGGGGLKKASKFTFSFVSRVPSIHFMLFP